MGVSRPLACFQPGIIVKETLHLCEFVYDEGEEKAIMHPSPDGIFIFISFYTLRQNQPTPTFELHKCNNKRRGGWSR